ncbi:lysozyme g-like [Nematolebias whitei]|uniref:lysozyme g-like n=1 Tax=Nematolebias whitei TaxID=451745 RepID=UPI00189BA2D5|nr:lysozyme g-like [Nematolebias whitei]
MAATFRDLDELTTTGASELTVNANNLRVSGVEASCRLARDDLHQMSTYKDDIIDVGRALHLHPALIAAIISKQSRAGTALKESGFGLYADCFGLMQISKRFHVGKGEPFSRDHIDEGTTYLIHLIKTMKNREETWTREQHLKGALVGYMIGIEGVPRDHPDSLDSLTPTKDFANDVIARAKVFAGEGYV